MLKQLLIVLAAISAPAAAADKVLDRVRIIVRSSGDDLPTEGRLYKILEGQSTREFVANVAKDGLLDAPFTCKSPVRIWAEPKRVDVTSAEEPRPCGGKMVFQFDVPLIAYTPDFVKAVKLSGGGDLGAAHAAFVDVAMKAAIRGDFKAAAVANNAATATAATALGDVNLSKLVTRESPGKGLVLTNHGKKVVDFQDDARLGGKTTLDFSAQKAIEKALQGRRVPAQGK